MPPHEVPRTAPPTEADADENPAFGKLAGLVLDMKTLAEANARTLPAMLAPLVAAYRDWIDREEARLDDPEEGLSPYGDAGRVAIDNCRLTLRRIEEGLGASGRRPAGVRGVRLHEPGHVAPADALDLLGAGPPGRTVRVREGHRPAPEPELAAVPDRLHLAQPAGRHPARPPRPGRRPRGPGRPPSSPPAAARPRRTWALRLHHGPAAIAGHGRRAVRRGGCGRPDAVHAPPPDHPAVPASHGAAVRLRVDSPQGPGARGRPLGPDAVPHRPLGGPPHHAESHRRRRGGDQAGPRQPVRRRGIGTPYQLTTCPWCGSAIEAGKHLDAKPTPRDRPAP
ncbi:MAG: hypothetical protein WKF75_04565 [Singulisphaera sp.]